MKTKAKKLEKPLTEVELQIMNAIWTIGTACTVKDVQTELSKDRDLAYTSVATIMKILEQKHAVKSEKSDKAHLYTALIAKADYETSSLKHLTDNLFQGNPSSLVMKLLSDNKLSKDEISAIKKILDKNA